MSNIVSRVNSLAGIRVAVTGASGFIGSHLVERLAREGATVAGIGRKRGKLALLNANLKYEFISCFLLDANRLNNVLATFAPQALLHFAAYPDARENYQQARASFDTNLIGTLNVLEAFRLCGGELFVYGDSCKVYGDSEVPYREALPLQPLSSYAIAKVAGWECCCLYHRIYEMAVVSVRPTLIYGPRQGYNLISFVVESILKGVSEIQLDGGSQTRDPLYIDDAIDAIISIIKLDHSLAGRVINIGGGNERTVEEIASIIVQLMDSNTAITSVEGHKRLTETRRSYCDNIQAAELLGWQPETDVYVGLKKTIQYLTTQFGENLSVLRQ